MPLSKNVLKLHNCDVRQLREILESYGCRKKFVDTTITSPPYFDMKTYGYENQIGHGQGYPEYLNDLEEIFRQIYTITKDTGSLWIILDIINKDGKVINLPFEVSQRLGHCSWNLREVIVWKKDKTLPWSRKGQLRSISEYVLFFTKSDHYRFYADRIRISDFSNLKEWWVRYPERYNPRGAVPTNVWEYPIPTQGSWGAKSLRHFNPLPPKMIERILLLTTDHGDVVFDPFAGSGTVLAVADFLGRQYFGFEMNEEYCNMFTNSVMNEVRKEMQVERETRSELDGLHSQLEEVIWNLRLVKFPKVLIKKLFADGSLDPKSNAINTVFAISKGVTHGRRAGLAPNKFMIEDVVIVSNYPVEAGCLKEKIDMAAAHAPLSKFGIEAHITVLSKDEFVSSYDSFLDDSELWLYSGVVHRYKKQITFSEWLAESAKPEWQANFREGIPPIISNVGVTQEIPKTWRSKEEQLNIAKCWFKDMIGSVKQ